MNGLCYRNHEPCHLIRQCILSRIGDAVWYALTSHQYKELCASETQPQPDMNNTEPSPHASTNQAQDPPTQPAETTAAFLIRIVQEYSLPKYLLKGSYYVFCGFIAVKAYKYATNRDIPINDRELTVKALCLLIETISKVCK